MIDHLGRDKSLKCPEVNQEEYILVLLSDKISEV